MSDKCPGGGGMRAVGIDGAIILASSVDLEIGVGVRIRPIYTVRFLPTIVACDFYSARCSRYGKIVYNFHDIKLPVATIVVGF